MYKFQSTHPHGVRPDVLPVLTQAQSFNPRTHTGCDAGTPMILTLSPSFQSTHPHGVRLHQYTPCFTRPIRFQSTHPHGVRLLQPPYLLPKQLFQSTHPHGVRRSVLRHSCLWLGVSIHAPTRGATGTTSIFPTLSSFQSTHPHGVRQCAKLHIISQ